ncbi:MAG: hypothetical protein WCJ29_04790 [bacterium]
MIRLANNVETKYFVASGALAFDGRGWWWERMMCSLGMISKVSDKVVVILKTLTRKPRVGNLRMLSPWNSVRRLNCYGADVTFSPRRWKDSDGFLNAIEFTNPGLDDWMRESLAVIEGSKVKVVVSIMPDDANDSHFMVDVLNSLGAKNVCGIEVKIGCQDYGSDTGRDISKAVEIARSAIRNSKLPIILKLGYDNDYLEILERLRGEPLIVDIIDAVRYRTMYPQCHSPFVFFGGGGVSGPAIEPYRNEVYSKIRNVALNFPIILGGGIHDADSVLRAWAQKPDAISIGSVLITDPNFLSTLE